MAQTKTHPSFHPSQQYLPVEDYALIGDLHTVALVGKNGSIDWCCLPRFDSPSVFGAILDAEKAGFFRISPTDTSKVKCKQLYLPETNILLTRFLSTDGVAELTDFMPIKQVGTPEHEHKLIRLHSPVAQPLTMLATHIRLILPTRTQPSSTQVFISDSPLPSRLSTTERVVCRPRLPFIEGRCCTSS